uniref:Uncharacterized protein n=1 Tax=Rhizophora mucronata TaxID=61149 RepID=A0A2P2N3G6_RHIMU
MAVTVIIIIVIIIKEFELSRPAF